MSSYRTEQLFIRRETRSRLFKVLRLGKAVAEQVLPGSMPTGLSVEDRIMTADELADSLINKMIAIDYPEVLELEKALGETEKKFNEQRAALQLELQNTEQQFAAKHAATKKGKAK